MNYEETLEYLYTQLPVYEKIGSKAYKPGLDTSLALDKLFHHPHRSYKTIHVGGTNGKGSISCTLAAILQEAGYTVGLYTSPHLVDFRERIRINGKMIEKSYVVDFIDNHRHSFEPLKCSFFELTMMMAFCYFRDKNVDIAIIEVGLGGRLDSTNIISPILSIISNIDLDHTQFLGHSLTEIADEKAGIIKFNTPVVIGRASKILENLFYNKAKSLNSSIKFAFKETLITSSKHTNNNWLYQLNNGCELTGELSGICQLENTKTILTALEYIKQMGFEISDKDLISAFANVTQLTGLQGRWQVIDSNPKIICDTAHNVSGIQGVVDQLNQEDFGRLHFILGLANDKDITHILEILPTNAVYYFVNAQIDRALAAQLLKQKAASFSLLGESYITINEAFNKASHIANREDLIFIGGSNFVVGEFLSEYNK